MARLDFKRPSFRRLSLMAATVAVVGALAGCGPGQGSTSTTVALTGPPDKVEALVARYKSLAPPAEARKETLDDGRERASFHLPQGLPMGEVIALGKDAANTGVNYEFSSGTRWGSGDPSPQAAPPPGDPARSPPGAAAP